MTLTLTLGTAFNGDHLCKGGFPVDLRMHCLYKGGFVDLFSEHLQLNYGDAFMAYIVMIM